MLRRTVSALVIVIACGGIAAAADLELLPKGHPKARPAERPVQTRPAAPSVPMPQTPAPVQQPPAQQAPAQKGPAQQPAAPQPLQSPATPGEQGKAVPAPAPIPAPLPGDEKLKDLQPPAMPPATGIESWWQKVVAKAPHCRTFSDGCRTCDTTFTCSSLPIACQPKEFVCADPASPPSARPSAPPASSPSASPPASPSAK